jgi:DNA-binding SARP family transcriptional activator
MIELRVLGTVNLVDGEGARIDALLRRPKRLALLAYLATARSDLTYRREKLLAMFWPEIDEARGRGSLRQSAHVLRQQLGTDALVALGDEELSLSPSVVRCDAAEFERAIREGRLADAVTLYGGDFLPGFFLDGAAEFDEWLESTRDRLRELAVRAYATLAEAELGAGRTIEGVSFARRAISIAPMDERAVRCLMTALDRAGDRGGALAAYDALAHRVHAEFEVLPSAETQALADTIRSRGAVREFAPRPVAPTASLATEWRGVQPAAIHASASRGYGRLMARGALAVTVLLLTGSRGPALTHDTAPTISAEAREAYERGQFYVSKPTEENLHRAVLNFERALDAEPLYPQAYAGLGDTYLRLGYGSYIAPSDAFPKAIAAALHAIELDSLASEPRATLAFARMYYDWDFAESERQFRIAIRLRATNAVAHDWYAYLLTAEGRVAEARRESETAQRLAPLSVAIAVDAGFVSFYGEDLAEARRQLDGALLMAPEAPVAHLWLGRVAQREGDLERARSEYEASGALRSWVPTIAGAGYVEALLGNVPEARRALARMDSLSRSQYVTPYAVALVHAALGESDQAFYWLDRAVTERAHWLVWINRDSRWAPLRGDARFAALVRRVGVP